MKDLWDLKGLTIHDVRSNAEVNRGVSALKSGVRRSSKVKWGYRSTSLIQTSLPPLTPP